MEPCARAAMIFSSDVGDTSMNPPRDDLNACRNAISHASIVSESGTTVSCTVEGYNRARGVFGGRMSEFALFSLSEEHKMIRDAARDFAQKEIVPIAAEFDESGEFPYETIKKMGGMGLMGIEVPEEYGGAGMDTL